MVGFTECYLSMQRSARSPEHRDSTQMEIDQQSSADEIQELKDEIEQMETKIAQLESDALLANDFVKDLRMLFHMCRLYTRTRHCFVIGVLLYCGAVLFFFPRGTNWPVLTVKQWVVLIVIDVSIAGERLHIAMDCFSDNIALSSENNPWLCVAACQIDTSHAGTRAIELVFEEFRLLKQLLHCRPDPSNALRSIELVLR
jgi:hypothetical protein